MAFASFTGVNDTALHIAVSQWIMERLVQESLYRDGLGLVQVATNDVGAGGVRVPIVKPSTGKWRKLGATENGGWFDGTTIGIAGLDESFVELLFVYDANEDVPVSQTSLSLGGISNIQVRAKEIGKNIARGLNAGTMAFQIAANVNAAITASSATGLQYQYNPATAGQALSKFMLANSELDNGDGTYHDYFPRAGRIALLRPGMIATLREKGQVIIGGSNFAQEILASGALDATLESLPEIHNGYVGMVDGVPVFKATNALWTQAEIWLSASPGYLDNVVGILCSHIGTGRGHAFPDSTKVIDSPNGQGLRIQPLSNFGAKVFFPESVKLFTKASFSYGSTPLAVLPEGSQE